MATGATRLRDERGETLIEVLVTVMIMGVAVVVIMGGLGAGITMSDLHRKQTSAGAYVRAFAEAVESAVARSPSAYAPCATTATYAAAYSTGTPAYTAAITAVRYWNGTAFVAGCAVPTDSGIQQLSLRVQSADGRAAETMQLIIRRPCRSHVDFPADPPCT